MAYPHHSTTAPVTTPAGLDFASRAKAFTQARDAARRAEEGPALDAAAEAEYAAAEALIETPAATPAQIAEKVAALMEVHNTGGTGQDLGMKSIRRDLIALDAAQTETRAAWDAALKAHDNARAVTTAALILDDSSDPDGGIWNAAYWAENEALRAIMFMRAPDPAAMAEKARRGINHAYVELRDESADDADTLERLLSDGPWDGGCVVAALYQDALALSGDTGPLSMVGVSAFNGPDWISATVAATGAGMAGMTDDWGVAFTGTDEQVTAARAAFDGLKHWQREAVVRKLNL